MGAIKFEYATSLPKGLRIGVMSMIPALGSRQTALQSEATSTGQSTCRQLPLQTPPSTRAQRGHPKPDRGLPSARNVKCQASILDSHGAQSALPERSRSTGSSVVRMYGSGNLVVLRMAWLLGYLEKTLFGAENGSALRRATEHLRRRASRTDSPRNVFSRHDQHRRQWGIRHNATGIHDRF